MKRLLTVAAVATASLFVALPAASADKPDCVQFGPTPDSYVCTWNGGPTSHLQARTPADGGSKVEITSTPHTYVQTSHSGFGDCTYRSTLVYANEQVRVDKVRSTC